MGGQLQEDDDKSEESAEPVDAFSKFEDFFLRHEHVHVDDIDGDNLGASRSQPAASREARNTSPNCVSNVARRSDKIAEAMIIPTLNSSRASHDAIITTAARVTTPDRANPT